jgi:hypothetical protein
VVGRILGVFCCCFGKAFGLIGFGMGGVWDRRLGWAGLDSPGLGLNCMYGFGIWHFGGEVPIALVLMGI